MAMSGGGRGDLNSEINVTPMVDVMLVLLVIFMVTAPLLNTGVEVHLPKTDTAPIKDPKGDPTLTITKARTLELDGVPVSWSDLSNQLKDNPRIKQAGKLQIAADESLSYNLVITAMAVAQNSGVGSLQLVSDPGAQLDLAALDKGQVVKAEKPVVPAAPPGGAKR